MKHRNRVTLYFDRVPRPKQSFEIGKDRKTGKPIGYTPTEIKDFERSIVIEALSQRPRGYRKMTGAVFAIISYRFAPTKSLKAAMKKQIASGKKVWKITKPDLTDNLNKPIFDALQGHFYINDSQVVRHSAEKIYARKAGIKLTLIELD